MMVASEHASLFESIFSAQIPTVIMLFFGAHYVSFVFWLSFRLSNKKRIFLFFYFLKQLKLMQLTVATDFLILGEKEVNITITITAQTMGITEGAFSLISYLEQTNLGLSLRKDK